MGGWERKKKLKDCDFETQASRSTEASANNLLRQKEVVIVALMTLIFDNLTNANSPEQGRKVVRQVHVNTKDLLSGFTEYGEPGAHFSRISSAPCLHAAMLVSDHNRQLAHRLDRRSLFVVELQQ